MSKKGFRILAAVLAIVCLIGTVAAVAQISLDLNGDSIVNIWDAQTALFSDQIGDAEREELVQAITGQILGTGSVEMTPNEDGVYEISSALGLRFMAENPTEKYVLTNDISLLGADWEPVVDFSGTLDGQGHKIYNFKITKSVQQTGTTQEAYLQAFFDRLKGTAVVKNLQLADFVIEADGNAQFIAPFAGSMNGGAQILNCTATGTISDQKTQTATGKTSIYYGALVGRIANGADATVTGGNTLTLTVGTESGKTYTTEGLAAIVKFNIQNTANVGLVGWSNSGTVTGLWHDTSNSTENQAQLLQERRQTVVDYMRDMATVKWMVQDSDLEYIKNAANNNDASSTNLASLHYQRYESGLVFQGITYSHAAGGMSRFLSKAETSAEGSSGTIHTMVSGLKDGYYISTGSTLGKNILVALNKAQGIITDDNLAAYLSKYSLAEGDYNAAQKVTTLKALSDLASNEEVLNMDNFGFVRYMGNDCSSAVSWAWRQVASVNVAEGGSFGDGAQDMIPTSGQISKFGLQAVNGFTPSTRNWDENNNAAETTYLNAYAKARRGDALSSNGHTRLLSEDAVVIRNGADNVVGNMSYFITIEQGDGLYDVKKTDSTFNEDVLAVLNSGTPNADGLGTAENPICYSWRIDYQYMFDDLINHATKYAPSVYNAEAATVDELTAAQKEQRTTDIRKYVGSEHYYVPVTIPALNSAEGAYAAGGAAVTPRVTFDASTGKLWSNFYITSVTADGNTVYTEVKQHRGDSNTAETGTYYRPTHTSGMTVTLGVNEYADLALTGQITVEVSNGQRYVIDCTTGETVEILYPAE